MFTVFVEHLLQVHELLNMFHGIRIKNYWSRVHNLLISYSIFAIYNNSICKIKYNTNYKRTCSKHIMIDELCVYYCFSSIENRTNERKLNSEDVSVLFFIVGTIADVYWYLNLNASFDYFKIAIFYIHLLYSWMQNQYYK